MDLYKRRTTPVWAVKFSGDPEELNDLLKQSPYELKARFDPGVWQVAKNGIPIFLLIEGEWLVRQLNGDIQVYDNTQFHHEYERVS